MWEGLNLRLSFFLLQAVSKYQLTITLYVLFNDWLCGNLMYFGLMPVQDLKDYMRQAGEVTYADAHKQRRNEGYSPFLSWLFLLITDVARYSCVLLSFTAWWNLLLILIWRQQLKNLMIQNWMVEEFVWLKIAVAAAVGQGHHLLAQDHARGQGLVGGPGAGLGSCSNSLSWLKYLNGNTK